MKHSQTVGDFSMRTCIQKGFPIATFDDWYTVPLQGDDHASHPGRPMGSHFGLTYGERCSDAGTCKTNLEGLDRSCPIPKRWLEASFLLVWVYCNLLRNQNWNAILLQDLMGWSIKRATQPVSNHGPTCRDLENRNLTYLCQIPTTWSDARVVLQK